MGNDLRTLFVTYLYRNLNGIIYSVFVFLAGVATGGWLF